VELVPDLVMEFVSEGEPPVEVDAKVGEWQSAGVRQVWVVPPRKGDVELLGEDVIPGFRCRVGDLIQGGREWSGDRPRKEKKGPLSISIA
jgi:Uma2 family endonuclease